MAAKWVPSNRRGTPLDAKWVPTKGPPPLLHAPLITTIQPGALLGVHNVQARAYSVLLKYRYPDRVVDTIVRRIGKIFQPYILPEFSNYLPETFKKLQTLRGHDAIRVLKTWCNGWCTSRRFQERPIHPCLFGCTGAEDSLEHYTLCPNLYAILRFFLSDSFSIPGFQLHEEPHRRIGLFNPDMVELKIVACTFSAYHFIKGKNRHLFYADGALDPTLPIPATLQYQFFEEFADAFSAEARELGIETRRFSSTAFNAFAFGVQANIVAAVVDGGC